MGHYYKIIGITDMYIRLEPVLHKLVKLVHVDVHENCESDSEANQYLSVE